ncbi:MAG: hypothetical protein HY782_18470 [Chloroflexi bacterium]|nr:hypothetical protein [Chloroflexota bacterium]
MPNLLSAVYEGRGIVKLSEEPVGVQAQQRVTVVIVPAVSSAEIPSADIPAESNLQEITHGLLVVEARLWEFERQHGLKSADFHRLATEGKLEELDGSDHQLDFIEWLGLYKLWLTLKRKYDQRVAATPDLAAMLE